MFAVQSSAVCGPFVAGRTGLIPLTNRRSGWRSHANLQVARRDAPRHGSSDRSRLLLLAVGSHALKIEESPSGSKSGWVHKMIETSWKVLVLAPMIFIAAAGGRPTVAAPIPILSSAPQLVSIRASPEMRRAATVAAASMSSALANPVVQVTALLGTVLVAGAAASRSAANRKRAQTTMSATPVEAPDVDDTSEKLAEPGVAALGIAALMVDTLGPAKSNGATARSNGSGVESSRPRVTSLNGRKGPGFMDNLDLSKYDAVHELMTKAKAATVDSKYDPINWLFDSVGSWQPKDTIVRTFLKNVDNLGSEKYDMLQSVLEDLRRAGETSNSKYDPIYELLKGEWSLNIGPLQTLGRWDPVAAIVRAARAPVVFVASKFDFLFGVLKGEWQQEVSTLDNIPEWDPMSAVVNAAGRPVAFEANRYDILESLLSEGLEIPTAQPVWDPIRGLKSAAESPPPSLQSAPSWDPLSRFHQTATEPIEFPSNRYDMLEQFFKAARAPVNLVVSKFDLLAVLLRGRWQQQNENLKNIPGWDPAGRIVEQAANPNTSIPPSKYDPLEDVMERFVRKGTDSTVMEDDEDRELPRRTWEHLQGNIAALSKELQDGETNLETIFN